MCKIFAHRKRRKFVFRMKHGTPDDGDASLEQALSNLRPQAVCVDRSVKACSDPATLQSGAMARYGDVHVQTGSSMIFQWHSKYTSGASFRYSENGFRSRLLP